LIPFSSCRRYTYDSFGRVTEEIASGIRKVYTYDSGDRVTSLKVYQGSVLEMDLAYEYDAAGQLTAVVSDGIRTTYRYDAAGRLTFEENGLTGVQTSYFYTPAGQIAAQVSAGGGEMLKGYAYEYDRNGNQTLKAENGQETRYYYDAIGRLETAELPDGTTQHYTYDARGNRASMAEIWDSSVQVTTYGYDPNNRLLYSENDRESYRYEYDPQGNQTKRIRQSVTFNGTVSEETEFYWNGAGMLAYSIDPEGAISSYAYGPDGLRTQKTVGGEETRYFYENGQLLLEVNGDGRITGKTVRGHRLIARETLLDTYGFLQDGHGDVTALVSPAGEIVLDYTYDPFGNETTAQTAYAAAWDNPFRYCGEYWDAETETYYLRARQYDPATGRFLSEDPAQDGFNWYVYCYGNPVRYCDPGGTVPVETVLDLISLGWSFHEFVNNPGSATFGTLLWDSAATIIPYVPGSYAGKTLMAGTKILTHADDYSRVGVWAMRYFERGYEIERALGGWGNNFPTIDWAVKTATGEKSGMLDSIKSIKSLDLRAKRYQNPNTLQKTLEKYIGELSDFSGAKYNGISWTVKDGSSRTLEVAIPPVEMTPAQAKVFENLQEQLAKETNPGKRIELIITIVS